MNKATSNIKQNEPLNLPGKIQDDIISPEPYFEKTEIEALRCKQPIEYIKRRREPADYLSWLTKEKLNWSLDQAVVLLLGREPFPPEQEFHSPELLGHLGLRKYIKLALDLNLTSVAFHIEDSAPPYERPTYFVEWPSFLNWCLRIEPILTLIDQSDLLQLKEKLGLNEVFIGSKLKYSLPERRHQQICIATTQLSLELEKNHEKVIAKKIAELMIRRNYECAYKNPEASFKDRKKYTLRPLERIVRKCLIRSKI